MNVVQVHEPARTLWTDEQTWYRQNTITGVVLVGGGLIWLIALAGA